MGESEIGVKDIMLCRPDGSIVGKLAKGTVNLTPENNHFDEIDELITRHSDECEFEIPMDYCIRRLLCVVTNSPLANNNWRKMHKIPMWRMAK